MCILKKEQAILRERERGKRKEGRRRREEGERKMEVENEGENVRGREKRKGAGIGRERWEREREKKRERGRQKRGMRSFPLPLALSGDGPCWSFILSPVEWVAGCCSVETSHSCSILWYPEGKKHLEHVFLEKVYPTVHYRDAWACIIRWHPAGVSKPIFYLSVVSHIC